MLPYWQQRRDQKLLGKKPDSVDRQEKKEKAEFFVEALKAAPNKTDARGNGLCENCGRPLSTSLAIPSAVIAHILPKRKKGGCPSVAKNHLNTWQGCGDCHTNYDRKGAEYVQAMPIFPELKRRVALIYKLIAPDELKNVPDYFKPKGAK